MPRINANDAVKWLHLCEFLHTHPSYWRIADTEDEIEFICVSFAISALSLLWSCDNGKVDMFGKWHDLLDQRNGPIVNQFKIIRDNSHVEFRTIAKLFVPPLFYDDWTTARSIALKLHKFVQTGKRQLTANIYQWVEDVTNFKIPSKQLSLSEMRLVAPTLKSSEGDNLKIRVWTKLNFRIFVEIVSVEVQKFGNISYDPLTMERRQKLYMPVGSVTSTAKFNRALLAYLKRYQPSHMLNELASRVWNCAHLNIVAEQLTQITSSKYMYIAQSLHATIKSLLMDPTDVAKQLALDCCRRYESQLCALAIDGAGPKTKPTDELIESILLECGVNNETKDRVRKELSSDKNKYDEQTLENSDSAQVHTVETRIVNERRNHPSDNVSNSPIFDRLGVKRRASGNKAAGEPEPKRSRLRLPSPISKSTLKWRTIEHLGSDSGNGSTSQESTISTVSSTTSHKSEKTDAFVIRHARNYGPLRQLNSIYNRPLESRKKILSEDNSNSIVKCSPRSSATKALATLKLRSLRNEKK